MTLLLVLLIFAIVFAALAAGNVPSPYNLNWGWLSFLFYLLRILISGL